MNKFKPYRRYRLDYTSETSGVVPCARDVKAEFLVRGVVYVAYIAPGKPLEHMRTDPRANFFKSCPFASLGEAYRGRVAVLRGYLADSARNHKILMADMAKRKCRFISEHRTNVRRLRAAIKAAQDNAKRKTK